RLTGLSVVGIGLITISIFVITGGLQAIRHADTFVPLLYGLLIGVMIASYTLLDKGAVSVVLIPPIVLTYGSMIGQVLLLTPLAIRNWRDVRREWRQHRNEAIGVGVLNQLAYILVLTAMTFTQVSHVAPVREMSIVIGAFIGSRMLSEGFGLRRMAAAGTMVIGVIIVALSGE
ncbi:EamA family transporter, partial [Lentibacillus halophilus]